MTARETYRLSDMDNRNRDTSGGLTCSKCGCHDFKVLQTREVSGRVTRRRQCRNCGHRITTTERVVVG